MGGPGGGGRGARGAVSSDAAADKGHPVLGTPDPGTVTVPHLYRMCTACATVNTGTVWGPFMLTCDTVAVTCSSQTIFEISSKWL